MAENIMTMGRTPTLTEYIASYRLDDLTFSDFFLREVMRFRSGEKIIVQFNSFLNKYMPEFKSTLVTVTLNEAERLKYRFNPKLMSFDLYGTTELWFMILEVNEIHRIIDFDLSTVILPQRIIVERMTRVKNLEQDVIDYNEERFAEDLAAE